MFGDTWGTLGIAPSATEKEIRRAYAVKLKQIDTSQDAAGFETLRHAYETALGYVRYKASASPFMVEQADHGSEPSPQEVAPYAAPIATQPDRTTPFKTLQSLVAKDEYSVAAWRQLLNDPLLDSPELSASFEHSLVQALTDHDTDFILGADAEWRELIESRYGWIADGLRYAKRFPFHADLRQTLVRLGKPKVHVRRPLGQVLLESRRYIWWVAFLLFLCLKAVSAMYWK